MKNCISGTHEELKRGSWREGYRIGRKVNPAVAIGERDVVNWRGRERLVRVCERERETERWRNCGVCLSRTKGDYGGGSRE